MQNLLRLTLVLFIFISVRVHAQRSVQSIDLESYGIRPGSATNCSPLFYKALQTVRAAQVGGQKIVLKLKKGEYHFYPQMAEKRTYYISNHDQTDPKVVGIPLENLSNIELDGRGAQLIFHGRMLPIAICNSQNVSVRNLSIDFYKPQISQVQIVTNDTVAGNISYKIAPWVSYQVRDSILYFSGEGWELHANSGIAFERDTRHIVYNTGDIRVGTRRVTDLGDGMIRAQGWKNKSLIPGTVVAMRGWGRPAPGIFIDESKELRITNVQVHYAEGMGLLAQLSHNIYLDRFGVCLKGKKDPRYFTTQADATHFSGCSGVLDSRNGLYEGMMDDAINVHGTYLNITAIDGKRGLRARYMHGQSYGFNWGYAGDTVQFIRSATMDLLSQKNIITSIQPVYEKGILMAFDIKFKDDLPSDLDPVTAAFGIENLSLTPSVNFTGNVVRNNRARGALFSTPRRVLAANNLFDHTSGSAILLCGDSNGWYETGSCRDVEIRNNRFVNALTSMYQFTNAVISVYPEIPDLDHQKQFFHSNIRITDNHFEMFDRPVLYAKSVDGLVFKGNDITMNREFKPFHPQKERILLTRVINADITNNKVDGKVTDLIPAP